MLVSRLGGRLAMRHLFAIDEGSTVTVRVERDDERRGRAILTQYDDKDFSLTDATSFAVMERLGITTAFTFDRHFAQYGWQVLEVE